jgi:Polyphosphate kinase 2 (PPK2)
MVYAWRGRRDPVARLISGIAVGRFNQSPKCHGRTASFWLRARPCRNVSTHVRRHKGSNTPMSTNGKDKPAILRRMQDDMIDSLDEELEMEIDDDRLAELVAEFPEHAKAETIDRGVYFQELFRLQGELVKLQDWVLQQKLKLVVIFEGRDAAGKGG